MFCSYYLTTNMLNLKIASRYKVFVLYIKRWFILYMM